MIDTLQSWEFRLDGRIGQLIGLRGASRDDLLKAMTRLSVDDWVPSPRRPQPFNEGFRIRIAWDGEEADEDDDGHDAVAEDDDEDGDEDNDEDGAAEEAGRDGDVTRVGQDENGFEADFIEWMREHIGERDGATLLVKTLVNRLGRYRAEQRLSTAAVHTLGQVLAGAGFITDPDLTQFERSPGIETRVRVSTRARGRHPTDDWRPVPEPPFSDKSPRPRQSEPTLIISEFERSAAKLKFLVSVAGSIRRLGETERQMAVARAGEGASLNTADRVRLRGMAHQYAGGHEDVNPTVRQLRVTLGEPERRQLLVDLRALAPPTGELEELIAAFATDLAVDMAPEPPPPGPTETIQPQQRVKDEANEQPAKQVGAGGVRENAALDDIFGDGSD
jgi:hypothetical protein